MANNSYHSLKTSTKWVVPQGKSHYNNYRREPECWNCGEKGHLAPKFNKKRNQDKIDRTKKAAADKRKAASGGGGGSGPQRQSTRKKWSDGDNNNNQGADQGVAFRNNKWMCMCKNGCGWNETHTTGFHKVWKHQTDNNRPFKLPSTHKFMRMTGRAQGGNQDNGSGGGGSDSGGDKSKEKLSKLAAIVERHKSETESSDFSSFLSDFHQVLESLN